MVFLSYETVKILLYHVNVISCKKNVQKDIGCVLLLRGKRYMISYQYFSS